MSIATALLLVGALGIMILMHSVGHGSHGASRGAHEEEDTPANDPDSKPESVTDEAPSQRRHGCC